MTMNSHLIWPLCHILCWFTFAPGHKLRDSLLTTGLVSYSDTTYSDSWLEWHFQMSRGCHCNRLSLYINKWWGSGEGQPCNGPEWEADVSEVLVVLLARLHVLPLVDRLRQVHLAERDLHLKCKAGLTSNGEQFQIWLHFSLDLNNAS